MGLVLRQLLLVCPREFCNARDPWNWTPLHVLAGGRGPSRQGMAEQLCLANADVLAVEGRNMTPLLVAASVGNVEVARALLAHGSDPYAETAEGATAADLAWADTDMQDLLRQDGVMWGTGPTGSGRQGGEERRG